MHTNAHLQVRTHAHTNTQYQGIQQVFNDSTVSSLGKAIDATQPGLQALQNTSSALWKKGEMKSREEKRRASCYPALPQVKQFIWQVLALNCWESKVHMWSFD